MKITEVKTISQLVKDYQQDYSLFEQEQTRIEKRIELRRAQIERLEKKLQNFNYLQRPSWIDSILKPIAVQIESHFPNRRTEISGPFGIPANTHMRFYRNDINEQDKYDDDNCLSISFRPCDLQAQNVEKVLAVIDYSVDTGLYKQGSMGEMNDLNYPTVPFPPDVDITWLLKWLR